MGGQALLKAYITGMIVDSNVFIISGNSISTAFDQPLVRSTAFTFPAHLFN